MSTSQIILYQRIRFNYLDTISCHKAQALDLLGDPECWRLQYIVIIGYINPSNKIASLQAGSSCRTELENMRLKQMNFIK